MKTELQEVVITSAWDFPQKNRVYLTRIVAEMIDKNMLRKIIRAKFHIIPVNAVPETMLLTGIKRNRAKKRSKLVWKSMWFPSALRRKFFIKRRLNVIFLPIPGQ